LPSLEEDDIRRAKFTFTNQMRHGLRSSQTTHSFKEVVFMATCIVLASAILVLSNVHAEKKDDAVTKFAKARLEAAEKSYDALSERSVGYLRGEDLYKWSKRILEGQRELARDKDDVKAALGAHLDRMKKVEKIVNQAARTLESNKDWEKVPAAAYYRIEAELWLTQAE
jgi:hypothetical protein